MLTQPRAPQTATPRVSMLAAFARLQLRRKPAAHGVLARIPWLDKVVQILRAARLRAHARHAEPAERLACHQGAGDAPVDIQIAHAEVPLRTLDVRRLAREHSTRELV